MKFNPLYRVSVTMCLSMVTTLGGATFAFNTNAQDVSNRTSLVSGEDGPGIGLAPERLYETKVTVRGKAQNTREHGAVIAAGDYMVYLGADKRWGPKYVGQDVTVDATLFDVPRKEDGSVDIEVLHDTLAYINKKKMEMVGQPLVDPATTQPATQPTTAEAETDTETQVIAEDDPASTQPTTQPATQPVDPMIALKEDYEKAEKMVDGQLLVFLTHGVVNEGIKGPRFVVSDVEIRVKYKEQDALIEKYLPAPVETVSEVITTDDATAVDNDLIAQVIDEYELDPAQEAPVYRGAEPLAFAIHDGIQPYTVPDWRLEAMELRSVIGGKIAELEAIRAQEEEARRLAMLEEQRRLEEERRRLAEEAANQDDVITVVELEPEPVDKPYELGDVGPHWQIANEFHGVTIGMTMDQVRKLLGNPLGEFVIDDRYTRWDYLDLDLTKEGPSPNALLIDFIDGKVARIRAPRGAIIEKITDEDGKITLRFKDFGSGGWGVPPFRDRRDKDHQ